MRTKYTAELTLKKGEERYLDRLLRHNWLYPLTDSLVEYARGKREEAALMAIAREKEGVYAELFARVEQDKRQFHKYKPSET